MYHVFQADFYIVVSFLIRKYQQHYFSVSVSQSLFEVNPLKQMKKQSTHSYSRKLFALLTPCCYSKSSYFSIRPCFVLIPSLWANLYHQQAGSRLERSFLHAVVWLALTWSESNEISGGSYADTPSDGLITEKLRLYTGKNPPHTHTHTPSPRHHSLFAVLPPK